MAFMAPILPFLPTIATVVGTGVAVVGAIQAGNAAAEAHRYQAMVADRQREVMLTNAERALQRSQAEAQQQDQTTRALLGEQLAAQSASGLKIGGRSQMLTRKSARELGRLDALNIRNAGQIEAYNYKVAAEDSSNAALFERSSASNSQLSGWLNAGSALIGGVGNLKLPNSSSIIGKVKVPSKRLLGGVY